MLTLLTDTVKVLNLGDNLKSTETLEGCSNLHFITCSFSLDLERPREIFATEILLEARDFQYNSVLMEKGLS